MADKIGGISYDDLIAAAMGNLSSPAANKQNESGVDETVRSVATHRQQTAEKAQTVQQAAEGKTDDATPAAEENPAAIYGFELSEFIDRAYALNLVAKAYKDMKDAVNHDEETAFDVAVRGMMSELFPNFLTREINGGIKCSVSVDTALLDLMTYGSYSKFLQTGDRRFAGSFEKSGILSPKNVLEYPLFFDHNRAFSVSISTDGVSRAAAESFVQYLIYSLAANAKKGDVRFRFADKEKGGQSFGQFITLAGSNDLFGNGICSSDAEISEMVNELNQIAANNFAELKGQYASVYEYNKANQYVIPITLAVFCDYTGADYSKHNSTLVNVINNMQSSGICTVFLTDSGKENPFGTLDNQMQISFENGNAFLLHGGQKAALDISSAVFSVADFNAVHEKLEAVAKVDTRFASHFDMNALPVCTRDGTKGIRIPFAFNKYNELVELELGDTIAHALLSGTTGSGKSTTLHSIIDLISLYYHPDDVEIWAIDYKAIEFNSYVRHRTPHFTVIGQDKSLEFSYSLMDLINKEYERRKEIFSKNGAKDLGDCRAKGTYLTRIVIVIDEFHNLTQAIQQDQNYKLMLENLLSEMRAFGMSFIFCSQTISSGLIGLTEKGRNQIGCRLCQKHLSTEEISATLNESVTASSDMAKSIKNFRKGEVLYKKFTDQGDAVFEHLNVLYIDENCENTLIDAVNAYIGTNYQKRHEIICKNAERFPVTDKSEHMLNRYLADGSFKVPGVDDDYIAVYPAAPTTLEEDYYYKFNRAPSCNTIVCVEDDELRSSVEMFTVMSLLADKRNVVNVSIVEEHNSDSVRLKEMLSALTSERLHIYFGAKESLNHIYSIKKAKEKWENTFEIFYGIHKLKSAVRLLAQEDEDRKEIAEKHEEETPVASHAPIDMNASVEEKLAALKALKASLISESSQDTPSAKEPVKAPPKEEAPAIQYDFATVQNIMNDLFENGSDSGKFVMLMVNNAKQLVQFEMKNLRWFDFRIGGSMSADDSYTLFGSETFTKKADDKTLVFYLGSNRTAITLRPYLMPDDEYIQNYNRITP